MPENPEKNDWLVVSTPLKNMKVNWDDYSIPIMWKNKKCSKPPTSHLLLADSLEDLESEISIWMWKKSGMILVTSSTQGSNPTCPAIIIANQQQSGLRRKLCRTSANHPVGQAVEALILECFDQRLRHCSICLFF